MRLLPPSLERCWVHWGRPWEMNADLLQQFSLSACSAAPWALAQACFGRTVSSVRASPPGPGRRSAKPVTNTGLRRIRSITRNAGEPFEFTARATDGREESVDSAVAE